MSYRFGRDHVATEGHTSVRPRASSVYVRSVTARTILFWLLAIAMLLVRVNDCHLHLCLDDEAGPSITQAHDALMKHGMLDGDDEHNDRDLDASVLPAAEKAQTDGIFVAGIVLLVLAIGLPVLQFRLALPWLASPVVDPLAGLRPPLRGPPI